MQDLEQVVAGWVLTGLVYLAAGLWALLHLPGPLRLLGALFVVHGTQGVRLGRRLALGHDDPWQRRALAKGLAVDAALLAATVLVFSR